eukprot:CAMPEP_0184459620 /NCGR_PEP_ID=MMETSP0740-20130409/37585_1 /TAXON_ID=385413 /ORGANISM="Thalassiosira miniscula, Strain CCMP1093" /LENGTH=76 /DNA_ID=CAMNT_0026832669 /DNA_START=93 /DNA_END=320 /DNA_ORIENTATION=-
MSTFFWTGTILGSVLGFLHMFHFFATRLRNPNLSRLKTIWQGLWVWGLWALFGAYVLAFWGLGLLLLSISRGIGAA